MEKIRWFGALAGGVIVAYLKQYSTLYILVAVAIMFDYASGMIAAVVDGEGLSSRIAFKGFLKKVILLVSVAFGTFLDALMPFCAEQAGIAIGNTLIFSTVICAYICISECISIAENIFRCTGQALPAWLVRLFKELKEKVGQQEDK